MGQDEHETLETLFRNVDLSFAKAAILNCFHSKKRQSGVTTYFNT